MPIPMNKDTMQNLAKCSNMRGSWTVGLVAALLVILAAGPLMLHPDKAAIGGGKGDFASIAWGLWSVSEAWPGLPPIFNQNVLVPEGVTILIADLPFAWLLGPFTRWFGPVVSYNLFQVLHVALAAAICWLLLRDLGRSTIAAATGAAAFSFSPLLLSGLHNGNPDVTPIFALPLTAWFSRRMQNGSMWALGLGLVVGMSAWLNPYVGVMSAIVAAIMVIAERPSGGIKGILLAGMVALLVAGTYVLLVSTSLHGPQPLQLKTGPRPISAGVAHLFGYIWPAFEHPRDPWVSHGWYLGLSTLGLALWGARSGWVTHKRWYVMIGIGLMLAMGAVLHISETPVTRGDQSLVFLPGAYLQMLPGMDHLQIVYRYGALVCFAVAALAAHGVDRLPSTRLSALAPMLVLVDLLGPAKGWTQIEAGAVVMDSTCDLVRTLPEGPVIDYPFTVDERWLLAQTCHMRPVAAGINKKATKQVSQLMQHTNTAPFKKLNSLGFSFLVLHTGLQNQSPRDQTKVSQLFTWAEQEDRIVQSDPSIAIIDLRKNTVKTDN